MEVLTDTLIVRVEGLVDAGKTMPLSRPRPIRWLFRNSSPGLRHSMLLCARSRSKFRSR